MTNKEFAAKIRKYMESRIAGHSFTSEEVSYDDTYKKSTPAIRSYLYKKVKEHYGVEVFNNLKEEGIVEAYSIDATFLRESFNTIKSNEIWTAVLSKVLEFEDDLIHLSMLIMPNRLI